MSNIIRKATILALALAVLAGTAGCRPQTVNLDANGNGESVETTVGGRLIITLPANPSTGYTWEVQGGAAPVLELVGEPEFTSDNPDLLGAGGSLTLTFRAAQPGTTTLVLVYHRPWETDVEPLDTFTVRVTVR
jgi:inhibitor of cysteine peptidase